MFLSELLHPIPPNKFREEIYEKRVYWWKAPPGASERFSSLYSWEKFDAYLNDWRNANHIQLADVNKDGYIDLFVTTITEKISNSKHKKLQPKS